MRSSSDEGELPDFKLKLGLYHLTSDIREEGLRQGPVYRQLDNGQLYLYRWKIALRVHLIARLHCYMLHATCYMLHADGLSPFIRAGNHWWVSDQRGKEGRFMRAEVEEADKRLPPVKGWEVYTPWKGEWSSEDQTLECSRHPTNQFRFSDPSVLLLTKGEAGCFQQFNGIIFSSSKYKSWTLAAMNNSDGKTPTLQSTQESKGGVFENKRREMSLNTKLTFSDNWNENPI